MFIPCLLVILMTEMTNPSSTVQQRQLTHDPCGHILTNSSVWSHDGRSIVYDVRSDAEGERFDGTRIQSIDVETGQIETLYESRNGAACGVVTCSPVDNRTVFIHGPEHPTDDWQYAGHHRRGVIVGGSGDSSNSDASDNSTPSYRRLETENRKLSATTLDARDLTPPFTSGALRGGSHVHVFSGDGRWVSFTYQDHLLHQLDIEASSNPANRHANVGNKDDSADALFDASHDTDQRNVGVSIPVGPVCVSRNHPRNHDGSHFSMLVTRTVNQPEPGSDQISRAMSNAWVGTNGYLRPDGTRQQRAIAFLANVVTESGVTMTELYIADLPDDLETRDLTTRRPTTNDSAMTDPAVVGICGTETRRPQQPAGIVQRRLTQTQQRGGIQGVRHWVQSSPDGSRIATLLRDESGIVQLWTVSPNGGPITQRTHNQHDIDSAFSWSPDGRYIAHVMDNSICISELSSGRTIRLTERTKYTEKISPPSRLACVFSPDGRRIAYLRAVKHSDGNSYNQIFVIELPELYTCTPW